jgi:hypothetical protein
MDLSNLPDECTLGSGKPASGQHHSNQLPKQIQPTIIGRWGVFEKEEKDSDNLNIPIPGDEFLQLSRPALPVFTMRSTVTVDVWPVVHTASSYKY